MKINYATDKTGSLTIIDGVFIFTSSKGVEVQSGEIKKVPTGIILRIPPEYVVQVTTYPSLVDNAVQIFPACISLTSNSPEDYLFLPIHNAGRNTFHIRPGDIIAQGFASPIEKVQEEIFVPEVANKKSPRTAPQKKNSDIKFEVN